MRAVFDPNVLISTILSASGAPARALRAWRAGAFELIVSPLLLDELHRALGYRKIRARISEADAHAFVELIRETATTVDDPTDPPPLRSEDPGDDYLLALAAGEQAVLVSGDQHLLALSNRAPIKSPASFLTLLEGS